MRLDGGCSCGGEVKYSQAVLAQTTAGLWKLFIQSDKQVERSIVGTLDEVLKELRAASTREWERRSPA